MRRSGAYKEAVWHKPLKWGSFKKFIFQQVWLAKSKRLDGMGITTKDVLKMGAWKCSVGVLRYLVFGLLGLTAALAWAQPRVLRIDVPDAQTPSETWQVAVDGLIEVTRKETQIPNVSYKFDACFLSEGECVAHSQGYRDDFKKVTYYHAPSKYTVAQNHVSFYLLLEDLGKPQLIMRYSYLGSEWLFINKVAVLVDGEIAFEQILVPAQIQRDALSGSLLYEVGDVLMNREELTVALIAHADTVAIKISGKNGDAYLDEEMLLNMQTQAAEILQMYDLLEEAIKSAQTEMTI